jgi:hypothetical protein
MVIHSILKRGFLASMLRIVLRPIKRTCLSTVKSIVYNFFYLQYRGVIFRKKVKVSWVDHPLDDEIPFTPSWINVYMDFSPFWVRTQAFLAETFGKAADPYIESFIRSIGELYRQAAVVYKRNFSTTRRPFYLGKPGFVSIHMLDPHLMCIPSLHVMVVVLTYRKMRQILRDLHVEAEYNDELETVRRRALDITESILYIKQHSINCISAGLYAVTCFDERLFPASEAYAFIRELFVKGGPVSGLSCAAIKNHILDLYQNFLDARPEHGNWEQPLLDFLENAGGGSR